MEMLVIGIIALAAFVAVLLPLFRRRPGFGDETEFENIPPATSESGPADSAASQTADPAAPGGAAIPSPRALTEQRAPSAVAGSVSDDEAVEAEVQRYREAVRAGTVCRKCGQANPRDSSFCFECGARLPLADAREFE